MHNFLQSGSRRQKLYFLTGNSKTILVKTKKRKRYDVFKENYTISIHGNQMVRQFRF